MKKHTKQIRPVKGAEVVKINHDYETLLENAKKVFGRSAGFVLAKTVFEKDVRGIKITPKLPLDYTESRVAEIILPNTCHVFEAKGVARITKEDINEIDCWGPYETGPPGGLFLDFAVKEFDRGLKIIKKGVEVCNIPLCVIKLPYYIEFKSNEDEVAKKRQLGVVGRLVKQKYRIEDFCYIWKKDPKKALKLIGFKNAKEYVVGFCEMFGKNIHRLLFDAESTHFALWDGGDVGIFGEIADFDSVHDLNLNDLADTIDGALSTIKRLLTATDTEENRYYEMFFRELEVTTKSNSLEKQYVEAIKQLTKKLLNKNIGNDDAVLLPKFNDPEHSFYYSNYVIT